MEKLKRYIVFLIGCLILGFGVYTEVLANVAMLPGESFVRAVSSTWKTEFGTTKVAFDVSLTVIAAVLSIVFARRLDGVREGTVIAALLVVDHRRSDNYRYYTRRIWGRAQNYDLTVNTEIGTEAVQNMIRELLEIKKEAGSPA